MDREALGIFAIALLVIGVVNFVVLIAALRKYGGRRQLCCGGCGYDVEGLETLRCPECGGLLRKLGIPVPTLRRGFATWFLAAAAMIVFATVTWVGWVFATMELDRNYPRSLRIADRREAFSIVPSVVPGETPRRRVVVVFHESPIQSDLPSSMYPRIDDYRGAIVLMVESDQRSTVGKGAAAAQKDASIPLLEWQSPLAQGVIGNILRLEDPKGASQRGIAAWMESLELQWQHPEERSVSIKYDNRKSVAENIAPIILASVQSTPGQSSSAVHSPIDGKASGGIRRAAIRVERARWVDIVRFGVLGAVNLGWWGVVAWWATTRQRALRYTQGTPRSSTP